ncbi:hypothetical protein [Frigidibacter sp. MR17.24]|uniref:hypothetical protein n=1 Tax=Frigidibacter sp. MR17.24 TaxID=3127345 RepID=UPI003012D535
MTDWRNRPLPPVSSERSATFGPPAVRGLVARHSESMEPGWRFDPDRVTFETLPDGQVCATAVGVPAGDDA